MNGIFLEQITADDLRQIVADEVKKALQAKPVPRQFTREEVAEMLHVTLATIHNWVRAGRLHPVKVNGRVLFAEEDVKNLLNRRR